MSKRIITLGTWDGKPIEWIVLKEESFGSLVISKLPLFSMKLSWEGTWASCNFRKELNGNFFTKAFTNDEKKKIVCSLLTPESTKDNVFLLSDSEANTLMSQSERKYSTGNCKMTCDTCYQRINSEGTCWYLRTAYDSGHVKEVNSNGEIKNNYSHDGGLSIRPAMWVRKC